LKGPSFTTAAALWVALVFPSLMITQKYLGWAGVVAYLVLAAAAVAIWRSHPFGLPMSDRVVRSLAAVTFALVVVIFLTVYPRVNSQLSGQGSDDDDANNVGAIALIHGHSPYAERTYIGSALHQLPGAFVLSLPFVLAGTSAIQNLFWLPLFFLAVREETKSNRVALHLAWLVLFFSPTVMHQVVTGTGYVANTIYVVLGLWWLLWTTHRDLAAVAWGVALATRANFLLLIPIAFGGLRQRQGTKTAVRATALTLATVLMLSLPFYLHDPLNFGPAEGANRLFRFDSLIAYSGETMLFVAAALAVFFARTPMDRGDVFRNCAIVQAIAPIAGTLLGTIQRGIPDLSYATYGTFFSWFAFMGIASGALYQSRHRTRVSD
jgi:hypothetical protein